MKKILIVKLSYEQLGGIDKQILRIVKFLSKKGYEFGLVTNDVLLPLGQEFKNLNAPVYQVDFFSKSMISCSKEIASITKRDSWGIIQAHLFKESVICRLSKLFSYKIKHVFRAQTYIDCAWIPERKKIAYHILDWITSFLVNIYIANGPEVEKEIINRSKVKSKKVICIINGTERLKSKDEGENKNNLNGKFKIAMVSNLLGKKGHDTLIRSLHFLNKKGSKVNARLVGDEISGGPEDQGTFKKDLIELAKKHEVLEQLEFYGYSSDIPEALKNIPIVVLPSDSEGVPNSILEAMSLRKIVVASNVGAIYKMIDDNVTGFIHEPRDYIGFADVLNKIVNMDSLELNKIANAGFEKWEKEFSIEQMINKLDSVYKKI
jgi:glycosyltransferase involved in cell wall biosynthesis